MDFLQNLKKRAKNDIKTIVLPETTDERVVKAGCIASAEGLANIILVGNEKILRDKYKDFEFDSIKFVDNMKYEKIDNMAKELTDIRKNKGLTYEDALDILKNPLYFGVMLVKMGYADGMVAGAINATANVLRPALQILKTAPNTNLVSAFFIMDVPDCDYGQDGVFLFGDAGLNPNPSSEQLADIAISSSKSFEYLVGSQSYVAMLSFSTKGSGKHEDVDKVKDALQIVKDRKLNINIDGELQADAAIVPSVAEKKASSSDVAGKANTLIFPDLDAGNIGYKLVQRLAKANAYGPITQGILKPVNDLSRGCSYEDIIGVIAITAVQAQNKIN